ncbi:MAG TPA: heavy metal translocating P-type ATPase metal-binding domain-containing protein, partial [Cryomorphaceae bacterium]|nr:heavy metal translocating P-type ATPase metal-binding domain-containing protein [Cryomorphaceae bacterium]
MIRREVREEVSCFHCGDPCESDQVHFQDKDFCCHGCKSVYELLQSCDLEGYYEYADNPGIKTLKA